MYFSSFNAPFEDSLFPIHNDKEVRELIKLCSGSDYVSIYIEHNDTGNDKGKSVG